MNDPRIKPTFDWVPMQVLQIFRNERLLAVAGAPNALLVSMHLTVLVNGEDAATIHVTGMNDLGDGRKSHTRWLDELALEEGDRIAVRLVNSEVATPPIHDVAADSEEHVTAQAQYETEMETNPPQASTLERRRPDASLELVVDEGMPIVAGFGESGELLMLLASWNRWHPERWRISLSSCSCEEALERSGGKNWFEGYVDQEKMATVRIGKLL